MSARTANYLSAAMAGRTRVRFRAGLTDWDIAKVQKCGGEGNFSETAVHLPRLAAHTPRLSEG